MPAGRLWLAVSRTSVSARPSMAGRGRVIDRVMVPDGQLGGGWVGEGRANFRQLSEHGVDMRLPMIGAMRFGIAHPQAGDAGGQNGEHDAPRLAR